MLDRKIDCLNENFEISQYARCFLPFFCLYVLCFDSGNENKCANQKFSKYNTHVYEVRKREH
jgi:hypothetical protein